MDRHIGNLSRAVGHDVSNRYSYIISQNDIYKAYNDMRDELDYPLVMDSKYRRAIVYNKKGLEKKINEVVNNTILNNIQLLDRMVVQDIVTQLNSIKQTSNGTLAVSNTTNSFASMLGSALAKGIVKGVSGIIDDMMK